MLLPISQANEPFMHLQLVATAAFGLESVVARELGALGYPSRISRPGRISFEGDFSAICRANLWLRAADRVLIQLAEFTATDFDTLFDTVRGLAWEVWIDAEAAVPVRGRARKSQLNSVPACQRTVKKAIVERLATVGGRSEIPETGPPVPVEVALLDDVATISIDTTGDGLHRREYRTLTGPAQIRETLAAGLVQLSFWQPERPFIDPFCGTGTIAIEAAMWGRMLAPGRHRRFAAEHWSMIPTDQWRTARREADDLALPSLPERIVATDADAQVLSLARRHAEQAQVADDIHFQQRKFEDLSSPRKYGCVICNPPYGERLGALAEIDRLYRTLPNVLRRLKTWSHFILTARSDLEELVGQEADRRRKLYNGRIACTYYQFFGPRPAGYDSRRLVPAQDLLAAGDVPRRRRVKPAFGGLRQEATRQADEFANRLRKRARHLRRWPTKRGITCYRIYERDLPEVPLIVDRYEDALHIAEFARPHTRTVAEHADWLDYMVQTAADALETPRQLVFVKHRVRQRGASQYQQQARTGVTRVVTESGLKFQVNLSDYIDTGLFLDHRLTRGLVRESASGAHVLNLFAYTGAFTVYAAAGGARQTTSVDLSPNYLDWTKANLELNGFGGSVHRLVRGDVLQFLRSLRGRPKFDLVVVDAPTFSNSKRLERDWDVQRDHAELLHRLVPHVVPQGVIYFSTPSRRFKLHDTALSELVVHDITQQTIPEDFRNRRIHQCWRMVKK